MLVFVKICLFVAIVLITLIVISYLFFNSNKDEISGFDCTSDAFATNSAFDGMVFAKKIFTQNEAYNFDRIVEHLPDGVMICPQVSFNAFIDCKKMSLRNQFNRKFVDCLLVDHDFNPLLVIEVDDDSHTSKKVRMRDLQRDEIALAAGIPTLRINNKITSKELERLIKKYLKEAKLLV